jgi:hypothetical protein
MTGGQSNLFQEINPADAEMNFATSINKKNVDTNKIKVVYANDDEIKAHKNYFQNS